MRGAEAGLRASARLHKSVSAENQQKMAAVPDRLLEA
jgi:hypothetical protein